MNSNEFSLKPPPGAGFLGDYLVFSAHGVGSETSPPFVIDGAVESGTIGQRGSGAYFFMVPAGSILSDSSEPYQSQMSNSATPWSGGVSAPAGTYRLEVVAAPDTHWNTTLSQFWVPPSGLTVSSDSTVQSLGKPVVVATGSGNWQSQPFSFPADPIGPSASGGNDMVFAAFKGNPTTAYLSQVGTNLSIPLPMEGDPSLSVPGPGQYYLVVEAHGPWCVGFEFGNSLTW